MAGCREILDYVLGCPQVEGGARRHQEDQIKQPEDIGARLVDGDEHQPVAFGQPGQGFHQVVGREAVEPRGGFIQDEDSFPTKRSLVKAQGSVWTGLSQAGGARPSCLTWVPQQLHCDADSAPLAPGHAPHVGVARERVGALAQPQLRDHVVHLGGRGLRI